MHETKNIILDMVQNRTQVEISGCARSILILFDSETLKCVYMEKEEIVKQDFCRFKYIFPLIS